MKVLVSACLMGENCKYNGGNNYSPALAAFLKGKEALPICPEMMAGLGCPRVPIEIVNGVVMNREGKNVDGAIRKAVEEALQIARQADIHCAVLQPRSPTCGVKQIYDGTFSGVRIPGSGVFAKALLDAGYRVLEPEDLQKEETL